ncbi:protein PHOSPHATE-INDUCED 1-like [Lycium barbarum]|uniref:protein PHOSPHATE-INDUCED 1-like n=1 Tax=Lycium barbarum TaxID=112863 RepID=UPI00293E0A24|nr:protein PHOSPHATE-INDUCED 1-like [Lycium barbarum]
MGPFQSSKTPYPLLVLVFLSLLHITCGTRNLLSLYQPPPIGLTYHNGPLLEGELKISILWYGKFSPAQKSIIVDFLQSLNSANKIGSRKTPTVSKWWQTIQNYLTKAGKKETRLVLSNQLTDESCSIGKTLKKSQISELAQLNSKKGELLTLVLTAQDVAVEGFCMSNCGYHGSGQGKRFVFIWAGNAATQCPGQCAWPFHQPIYGPQATPLGAPNGDVGADGMVVNIASLLAGVVTNPYGNGYYQGPAQAPLEAASACAGLYGRGAYPGYVGELLVDSITGASYNAHGTNGRKYLLPGLFDPNKSACSTIV